MQRPLLVILDKILISGYNCWKKIPSFLNNSPLLVSCKLSLQSKQNRVVHMRNGWLDHVPAGWWSRPSNFPANWLSIPAISVTGVSVRLKLSSVILLCPLVIFVWNTSVRLEIILCHAFASYICLEQDFDDTYLLSTSLRLKVSGRMKTSWSK